jgi:protein required for attachment to host cells
MSKTQMQTQKRSGYKWSVNECLRLEREYDLLKLSVSEIALLHERSDEAIMYKLDQEGIADFNHLYVKQNPTMFLKEEQEDSDEEEKDSDDSSNYEGSDEGQDEEQEEEEKYNAYNLKQQVQILTKQLANLTAIVYKSFLGRGKSAEVEATFH